jgi:4a-hydroxytetrahydrobiopterin dehydratase
MINLAAGQCVPCRKGAQPLTENEIAELMIHIPAWELVTQDDVLRLRRKFKFKNFAEAVAFTNKIAAIADEQDHHPQLIVEWGSVTAQWWTHAIKGLHRNDFIMAAKTDELFG